MLHDAIVLAGGKSSRLAGVPKAELVYEGETLLKRTVAACSNARGVAVVGDVAALDLADRLSDRVLVAREDPPFSGPAAGISAGMTLLAALESESSDYTLVLACDMPDVEAAVHVLLAAIPPSADGAIPAGADGVIAVDAQRHPQFLVAVYRTAALAQALENRNVEGLSVQDLVSDLDLVQVPVPNGSTNDIDTWEDAARYGITEPEEATTAGEVTP